MLRYFFSTTGQWIIGGDMGDGSLDDDGTPISFILSKPMVIVPQFVDPKSGNVELALIPFNLADKDSDIDFSYSFVKAAPLRDVPKNLENRYIERTTDIQLPKAH